MPLTSAGSVSLKSQSSSQKRSFDSRVGSSSRADGRSLCTASTINGNRQDDHHPSNNTSQQLYDRCTDSAYNSRSFDSTLPSSPLTSVSKLLANDETFAAELERNNSLNAGLLAIFTSFFKLAVPSMASNKVGGLDLSRRATPAESLGSPSIKAWSAGKFGANGASQNKNDLGSILLGSNRVGMIRPYFTFSSCFAHAISDVFEGHVRGKLDKDYIFFDRVVLYFIALFSLRNVSLAFIEDVQWRGWLGETEFDRPQRQMLMVYTILSVYIYMIYKTIAHAPKNNKMLTWLSPFQVLRGVCTSKSYGLDDAMLERWYVHTLSLWRWYFFLALTCASNITIVYLALIRHRWKSGEPWFDVMQIFWSLVSVLWTYIAFTLMYIHFVYFNSLCFYFNMRYEKVNNDIEVIITQRLKANERVQMLQQVLVEHNELCLKVSEYNDFWAKYLMSTYFYLISIICFTAFQAFFTTNYIYIRGAMFIAGASAAFVITRLSVSASIMSNTAHAPYNRLIRVTFDKYPIELQIQLRMFIQRTSGPTIGFYCLDVFEITYTTYASILAALGQNFLLIVDFVRSYAEVSREYEEINLTDLGAITNSLFNSTLDVLDEMTGTDISSSITNTSLIQSIIQQK